MTPTKLSLGANIEIPASPNTGYLLGAPNGISAITEVLPQTPYDGFTSFAADFERCRWLERGSIVILIRHGESLLNRFQLMQGNLCSPLTARGRWEATRTRDVLRTVPINLIKSSPLERAYRTAQMIGLGQTHPPEIETVPEFTEPRRGVLEGSSKIMDGNAFTAMLQRFSDPIGRQELLSRYDVSESEFELVKNIFLRQRAALLTYLQASGTTEATFLAGVEEAYRKESMQMKVPGGESLLETFARAVHEKQTHTDPLRSSCCALVAHGLFNNFFLLGALGLNPELHTIVKQGNCSINVLFKPNGGTHYDLLVFNSTSHVSDAAWARSQTSPHRH